MRRGRLLIALVIALISVMGYYGLQSSIRSRVNRSTSRSRREQEIALGLQSAPEMAEQFGGLDPDASVQCEVADVGEPRSCFTASRAETAVSASSSTSCAIPRTVNAFALPGGPIFITRGLIETARERSAARGRSRSRDRARVARHSAEQIAKSQLAQGLDQRRRRRRAPDGVRRMAGKRPRSRRLVAQMVQLKYGRKRRAAIRHARRPARCRRPATIRASIACRDEDSRGGQRRPGGQPEFMSSHPDPGNRQALIQQSIDEHFPNGVPPELTLGRSMRASGSSLP